MILSHTVSMSAYSLDLRQRVLAAVARGMLRQEIVTIFAISLGTLKRWLAKQRQGLNLRPGTPSGPQPTITPAHHVALRGQLEDHPDATLAEHAALWNAVHGTTLSQWTFGRAIRGIGWTRKKRRLVPLSGTRQHDRRSASGSLHVPRWTSSSWTKRAEHLNLTPRYARAPRGQRAPDRIPRNTPPNTTLIAAMTTLGMGAAMVMEGATDTRAFEVYVEHFLVPSLTPGMVVVLDNVSAHKSQRVHALIAGAGCELWYLPAYSPDLSPIEEAFSKLKTLLRRAATRTKEALLETIGTALGQITSSDARGYFTHCGYDIPLSTDQ